MKVCKANNQFYIYMYIFFVKFVLLILGIKVDVKFSEFDTRRNAKSRKLY